MSRFSLERLRATGLRDTALVDLPPLAVDSLLAMGMFILGMGSRSQGVELIGDVFTREPDGLNVVLIALQTLPLALRRRYPMFITAVVVVAFAVDRGLDYPGTYASAGMILAFHALGSELPPARSFRLGLGLVAVVVLWTLVGVFTYESVEWTAVISMVLFVGIPLVLGREVYQRRQRIQLLEARAERAEREREERAREAVAEERARIARELHDVVAHQMAVMTLQAEGARRIAGDADSRVAQALDTIRQTGHDALIEMRRMVGLLRGSESALPAGRGGELAPQPGLDDLDRLIEQMREAGLEVEFERTGHPCPLPSGLDLNAFRIVQESLTNALKHGGPNVSARVVLGYTADSLDIRVTDDGRGRGAGNGGGQGLVGMRERVALMNGELSAGPLPDKGFLVHATLPLNG